MWRKIIIRDGKASGVITKKMGVEIKSKSVILCNGTFLNGLIHLGEKNYKEVGLESLQQKE